MEDQLFNLFLGFGIFMGIMLSVISVTYLAKLFQELGTLKSQKKAYDLLAKEEAYNIKLADLELKEKQTEMRK